MHAITFYKKSDFSEAEFCHGLEITLDKPSENKSFSLDDDYILKYHITQEIDYTTVELWLLVKDSEKTYSNEELIQKYLSL